MIPSGFLTGIQQKTVTFKKYKTKSPLVFYDLHMMGGIFTASLKHVKRLLPKNYHPVQVFPGKALLAVHCMEYHDSDIGPYGEVSISVILKPPGFIIPGSVKLLLATLTKNVHVFVQELPVTTDVANIGGIQFFKFPKFVADISFRETKTHRICTLRDKKTLDLILEIDCMKISTRHIQQNKSREIYTVHTYSQKKDPGMRGKFKINLLERGMSFLMPRISLRWGKHPLAIKMNELKWGIQLQSVYAPQCEAVLYPAEGKGKCKNITEE